jgi:hypothetical protein
MCLSIYILNRQNMYICIYTENRSFFIPWSANGKRKSAFAVISIYINIYIHIYAALLVYIHIRKTELAENGNFRLLRFTGGRGDNSSPSFYTLGVGGGASLLGMRRGPTVLFCSLV